MSWGHSINWSKPEDLSDQGSRSPHSYYGANEKPSPLIIDNRTRRYPQSDASQEENRHYIRSISIEEIRTTESSSRSSIAQSPSPSIPPPDIVRPLAAPIRKISCSFTRAADSGPLLVYISTEKFFLMHLIFTFLEVSGPIPKAYMLSYNTFIAEFKTPTSARHAYQRFQAANKTDKRLRFYQARLVSSEDIAEEVNKRTVDIYSAFNPPKCLILHGFDFSADLVNYFRPFDLETYKIEGQEIVTYHRSQASVNDFMVAFQERKSGLPSTWVEERFNTKKLKEEVYQIVRQKLVEDCMKDCNQMLSQDLYFYHLRKAKFKQMILPLEAKSRQLGIKVYSAIEEEKPSQPPKEIGILGKVKKATREKQSNLLKTDRSGYSKKVREKMTETYVTFDGLAQPELNAPCSRMRVVAPIKEKRKRVYLRAYAKERLHPFTIARESGLRFRETQFPVDGGTIQPFSRMYFEKSTIQGWGLFAMEPINPEAFVCEYTGELIRSQVADIREKKYQAQGLPHMYLFRVNGDTIIDATTKGGLARFLNHSCHPNCRATVVNKGSEQTISFYAIRYIKANDEITFNYNLEFEDKEKREKCFCGSKQCLGYLNYCADPEIRRKRELEALQEMDNTFIVESDSDSN